MKKFVFALFASLGLVGFVLAEEFNGGLSKVEGSKVTITKEAPGGGKGAGAGKKGAGAGKKGAGKADPQPAAEPVVYDLAPGAVIGKGVADADKKGSFKLEGTAFANGVMNEAFKDAKDTSVRVHVTTADEDKGAVKKGQVTELLVIPAKGAFGGKKGGKATDK